MSKHLFLVGTVVFLTVVLLASHGEDKEKTRRKAHVRGIANALSKGNMKLADTLAQVAARSEEDVEKFMKLLEKREKEGLGVRVTFRRKPESIEKLIYFLAERKVSGDDLKKNANVLADMSHQIAAVAKICEAKPPRKERGKKTKRRWLTYSESMRDGSLDLAKAARLGVVDDVHAAAVRIKGSCNSCHKIFRD